MSVAAVAAPSGAGGEQSALERVRQLQALIEQTQAQASGASPAASAQTASAPDFAGSLRAATASVAAPAGEGSGSTPYDATIEAAAVRNGVDPAILHGLIQQESGFDPGSRSSAGALGLTQLMPGTASSLGVANPLDPTESIEGGARYLGQLLREFGGDTTDALAAYNAGPGAVRQYGGVPPYAETQDYVAKVTGYAQAWRQSHPVAAGGGSA